MSVLACLLWALAFLTVAASALFRCFAAWNDHEWPEPPRRQIDASTVIRLARQTNEDGLRLTITRGGVVRYVQGGDRRSWGKL